MNNTKKIIKYCVLGLAIFFFIITLLGYTNLGNLSITESSENIFVNIENEKIRISQKGNGKDILLIHGSPGSIEDWNSIVDALAKTYRVTTFDRAGHGFSSSNEYTYHIKDNAILVERLIEQLGLKDPLIVGHSYGGSTAAYMAVHSDLKELKYIILDSPLYKSRSRGIYKLISTPVIGKGIALASSYTIANSQIRDGVTPIFKSIKEEKIQELVKERQRMWSQPKVIYTKSMESINYQDDLNLISHKYKNIVSDITIITAKDSINTLRKDCEKFHSEVLNSELIILDNTGHYIQFDKSNDLIEVIHRKMSNQFRP
ncbi:alpha/beta fold hydrolase [Aquimarina sp. 2201CG14-23]|uniref:alpha/beta fold hydrolase n=1 Tax=Aquimarina mycalae TaxID=3040073 RepID=UPI0024782DDF|nr:alpha/beta hydrolase [Aquimarina sp. 2201CG14-23]MDH7445257.1 alpha/beta hydrolase [Aquimarina sp. 2201CG14-23]